MEEKQKNENQKTEQPNPTDAPDFWTPGRVRMLAGSVVFMSFLLLLGFGMVVYKLIEKAMVPSTTTLSQPANAIVTLTDQDSRKHFKIDLNGYKIKDLESNGRLITLHVEKAGKGQIWIIDSSEKTIKSIVELQP